MTHPLLGSGFTTTDDGHVVSSVVARVAEILLDYNPDLRIYWIEPGRRETAEDHDKPFMIMHEPMGREPYCVAKLGAQEMNDTIIARIFAMDMAREGAVSPADKLEAMARAREIYQAKKHEDEMAEARDIMRTALKSPLHKWTGPNGLVVRG